jgi:hypothetical protein
MRPIRHHPQFNLLLAEIGLPEVKGRHARTGNGRHFAPNSAPGVTRGRTSPRRNATENIVNELRLMKVTPHVAQDKSVRRGRSKRIEEAFGWIKTIARQDKTKFRGRDPCRGEATLPRHCRL